MPECKCGEEMERWYSEAQFFDSYTRTILPEPAVFVIWKCKECSKKLREHLGFYVGDEPRRSWTQKC